MIEIGIAIQTASLAFGALKKGISVGRDLESMGKDLSRWAGAIADIDFAKRQNDSPPFYRALSSNIEKDAVEIWNAQRQIAAQRKELKDYISAYYGPSHWNSILEIEAELRKQKREHEHRQIEIKRKIIEWVAGIFLFVICVGALVGLVWLMKTANE